MMTFFLKLLICCILIVSKVVVKYRYWVGLGMWNMAMQNVNNRHVSEQLANSENGSLLILKCYHMIKFRLK